MAKTRKLKFQCPANVTDRTVKKGGVTFSIDPSASAFLLKSKARKKPVNLLLVPDASHKEIDPIPLFGLVKGCELKFEDVAVPANRLADLEYLIREKNAPVTLQVETEDADLFADLDGQDGSDGGLD
jgi:hypothetical protein